MEIQENILNAIQQTSFWEWLAVGTGVLYVVLISFKNRAVFGFLQWRKQFNLQNS